MIMQWWELVLIAAVCTFAGWYGAPRVVSYATGPNKPVPLSEFTGGDVLHGTQFECDGCHGRGWVRIHGPITVDLECSSCHSSKKVLIDRPVGMR